MKTCKHCDGEITGRSRYEVEHKIYCSNECRYAGTWRGKRLVVHRVKEHPLFVIWQRMIQRCYMPTEKNFHNYGGRGIGVCERWRNSLSDFAQDVGQRPSAKHSIDRFPNNDGNYEPGNVRWATTDQQARNQRRTIILTAFGETKPMRDWSDDPRCAICFECLRKRILRGNMTPEDALITKSGLAFKYHA